MSCNVCIMANLYPRGDNRRSKENVERVLGVMCNCNVKALCWILQQNIQWAYLVSFSSDISVLYNKLNMNEKKFSRGGSSKNSVSCVDEEEITLKLRDDGRSCRSASCIAPWRCLYKMWHNGIHFKLHWFVKGWVNLFMSSCFFVIAMQSPIAPVSLK
jgi:hypothetical protein